MMPYRRVERRGTGLVLSQAFGSTYGCVAEAPISRQRPPRVGHLRKRPAKRLTEDRLDAPKAAIGRVRAGVGRPKGGPRSAAKADTA